MINAVGRDIPEEILELTGKQVFQGNNHFEGVEYRKQGPIVKPVLDHNTSKLVGSIREALEKCGAHDGMTLGFHHHFREGDLVVNMVMKEVQAMGFKDITICASSLGKAHDALLPMIEDGTITGIESSGVRGKIGDAISNGKLKKLAIMRSHGGRVRAIHTGEATIDISFIGAPTCDDYGNCKGIGGKSDCGVLSYSFADGNHANKVVAVTDCLVPFDVRWRLVKAGTAHLDNVVLHETGPYLISAATFPSYFLKDEELVSRGHAELDAAVFGEIAKALGITRRFLGDEPVSKVTALYNEVLAEQLPKLGVECTILSRKRSGEAPISASTVRQLIHDGNWDELETLLPETTLEYFRSKEAQEVVRAIQSSDALIHH